MSHAGITTLLDTLESQWGRRWGGLFKANQLNSPWQRCEHPLLTSTLSNCHLFLCFRITQYLSCYEPNPANVLHGSLFHLIDMFLTEIDLPTLETGVPEWIYRLQQQSNISEYNFGCCTKGPLVPSWSQDFQLVLLAASHKGINWWHLLISKGSANSLWSGILLSDLGIGSCGIQMCNLRLCSYKASIMENHFHSHNFLVPAWCIQLHSPLGFLGDLGANEHNFL